MVQGGGVTKGAIPTNSQSERAILVGIEIKGDQSLWSLEDSMKELALLAQTAGAEVIGALTQKLNRPTPSYLIGKGKLEELIELRDELGSNLIIFDEELSPSQLRNLDQALGVKVLDRTGLILDVFAKRAHTREGKLQVELAQQEYLLPRLAGLWTHLERTKGGIGTKGPGEKQLEYDRRMVESRIKRLKDEIEEVRKHRSLYRQRRESSGIPIVALVGYTNAGKSTLMNALSRSSVFVEDKLFATLDPTTRRLRLPNNQDILLSDTVGFIQKLPPRLLAAFKATLEELSQADLILHVLDITHPNAAEQGQTVDDILEELGLEGKPRIIAINKIDMTACGIGLSGEEVVDWYVRQVGDSSGTVTPISAAKGWGLDRLLSLIASRVGGEMVDVTVEIPYTAAKLVHLFHQCGLVEHEEHTASGSVISGKIPRRLKPRFREYAHNRG